MLTIKLQFLLFNFLVLLNNTPEDYMWKNRIFILSDSQSISETLSPELIAEVNERKLLIYQFDKGDLIWTNDSSKINTDSFLEKLPQPKSNQNQWVLIGLDGGIKDSGNTTPNLTDILNTIDAMPMRQSEIRRKKDGKM
jgi:hypothetical protein